MSISTHFKLYKPVGMLSQLRSGEERQVRKKKFLGELYNFPSEIMPIGRLDEKSEGLLLMTTDGKLSNHINHSDIEKEYYAQLDGAITKEAIAQISNGVSIGLFGESYRTKPCAVRVLGTPPMLPKADKKLRIGVHRPTSWISITLTEGKFRQVRKMTAAVGFPTIRLVRVRIGSIGIEEMKVGDVLPIVLSF
ncbi:pseudouridine synthase [Maribacter sp. R77961]|uniref:pseudouridine synthase n=1 Tax=Maribacter sp. R77961 TaxID=3093871 RepID=UPI0037CB99DC